MPRRASLDLLVNMFHFIVLNTTKRRFAKTYLTETKNKHFTCVNSLFNAIFCPQSCVIYTLKSCGDKYVKLTFSAVGNVYYFALDVTRLFEHYGSNMSKGSWFSNSNSVKATNWVFTFQFLSFAIAFHSVSKRATSTSLQ